MIQETETIEPGRLRRALTRRVRRIGANRFLVEGRTEPEYLVDLDEAPACRCVDATVNRGGCLHELAARLHVGDPLLVEQVAALVFSLEREVRTLHVRQRRARGAA